MKRLEVLWLLMITLTASLCGIIYAIFNTDPHHWGFISGTALDYIHGKKPFSEIYIQYGVGQTLLFSFLSHFFPINFTTTGILTSLLYGLTLSILFFTLSKITNKSLAILITTLAFLMHSYAIYPWPDYYSGFFLMIGTLFLIKGDQGKKKWCFALAGFFLFIAFLFRNTYVLSIFASSFAFGLLSLVNRKVRNKGVFIFLSVFYILIGCYFTFLYMEGDFGNWYQETIGAGSSQYGIGLNTVFNLLRKIFLPEKIYLPNNLVRTLTSVLFYAGSYALLIFGLNRPASKRLVGLSHGMVSFLALLGLSGMIQGTLSYELFRLQNSCSGLYLILAIMIAITFPECEINLKTSRKLQGAIVTIFILLLAPFPHGSSLFPLYDGSLNSYQESKIPYFRWHRFRSEEQEYYDGLAKVLCGSKNRILNLTMDSTIPYLCEGQENALGIPFYFEPLLSKMSPEQVKENQDGNFKVDEYVVSDAKLPSHENVTLIEIGHVFRPKSIRFYGNCQVQIYRVQRTLN